MKQATKRPRGPVFSPHMREGHVRNMSRATAICVYSSDLLSSCLGRAEDIHWLQAVRGPWRWGTRGRVPRTALCSLKGLPVGSPWLQAPLALRDA